MHLCETHLYAHDCVTATRLANMTTEQVREWKRAHASEEDSVSRLLSTLVLLLPGCVLWQAKKRGGFRPGPVALYVPDIIGHAEADARFIGIELKNSHGMDCQRKACGCSEQREWGMRLILSGGVFIRAPAGVSAEWIANDVRRQLLIARDKERRVLA